MKTILQHQLTRSLEVLGGLRFTPTEYDIVETSSGRIGIAYSRHMYSLNIYVTEIGFENGTVYQFSNKSAHMDLENETLPSGATMTYIKTGMNPVELADYIYNHTI
ncbi:MAG: hypothetical protein ACRCZZ_06875 [Phocaeicola sp.]